VIHSAAGLGFGQGVGAGNAHRFMPNGWILCVKYLVEELGFDINARDDQGFTPLHFAAARGDNEMIVWMVEHGADPTAVSRTGYTTADMANGPQPRITPMPATVALLESLGSKNSHNCRSCQ
jgi:ankyrin repeat protein